MQHRQQCEAQVKRIEGDFANRQLQTPAKGVVWDEPGSVARAFIEKLYETNNPSNDPNVPYHEKLDAVRE